MRNMKYRPDIDGLRAIAVLSVMLFHAGISAFAGGFIGVDIFFVISGYLITTILISEIEGEKFSIIKFYERRIRRIIPALIFMMTISVVVFSYILIPDDLENFGQSIVATTFFSNNILLWMTAGYFDPSIDLKPLVHTWSLGVEEQFYLFSPILLIIAYKFWNKIGINRVLIFITVTSYIYCIYASTRFLDANFYLIFSRIWEIGAGSIIATQGVKAAAAKVDDKLAAALSNSGLLIILLSNYFYGFSEFNPNVFTLICILGICAVISLNRQGSLAYTILSNRTFVVIGAMSYSLYLWHQPIYVFTRVVSLEEPALAMFGIGIIATFVMGYISWRFVEVPFRDRDRIGPARLYVFSASFSAILIAIGLAMHFTSGFYSRWPELAKNDKDFGKGMNIAFNEAPYKYLDVQFDPDGPGKKVLVIGNSFARDFINMMDKTHRLDTNQVAYSDAKPCEIGNSEPYLTKISATADIIVMATKLNSENIPCIHQLREKLVTRDHTRFVVIGTKNFGWNNNAIMMLDPEVRYTYQTKVVPEYLESNELGLKSFEKSEYVDVLALISQREGYVPVFTEDRKFISQDREHLTPAGAKFVGERIFQGPILSAIRPSQKN
ncbi:acyltransferase family protein [Parasphingorhabdus halotolerans]|uniref:Acyltransferase n=1 Tax=Parasphingorhabdus halotolerans TaxID=2725558 RepID=A0A6H2DP34_9SPHN|nr:acyltransferase [Parasphingorhabdus halotolerans]QJB69743.1 acyltransferase [Parasphingorhabdus halotolerans]